MSIPAKITSIENHITEAYDKLDELGVDLTNIDKNLDNISNILDDLYEEYPKVTTTNVTEPSLTSMKAGKMEINLKGNTDQFTTTGKNLLPQNKYIATQTINGITYTNNGDGTFNLSGTATANTTLLIIPTGQISLEANQPYYFSSSTTYDGQTFNISIVGDEGGAIKFLQAGATYTYSQTPTQLRLVFYIENGKTVSSSAKNVKLQLEQGSSATSYEPYTGVAVSPSPDYPQKVEVVSRENTIKVVNKNLFDIGKTSDYFRSMYNGEAINSYTSMAFVDFNIANNKLLINTYNGAGYPWISKFTSLPKNTNLVISGTVTQDFKIIGLNSLDADKKGTVIKTFYSNQTSTTFNSGNYKYYMISFFPLANSYFENIQIEESSTATTYTEHKEQDFPISLKSKNLYNVYSKKQFDSGVSVDNEGWITAEKDNTSSSSIYLNIYTFNLDLVPGKQYSIVLEVNEAEFNYSGNFNLVTQLYSTPFEGQFTTTWSISTDNISSNSTYTNTLTASTTEHWKGNTGLRTFFSIPAGKKGKIKFRISVLEDTTVTPETFVYLPYFNYELCKIGDYQDSIKRVIGKNLFDKNNTTIYAGYFDYQGKITGKGTDNNADKWFYIPCKPNTTYTITKPLQETTSNNRFRIGTTSNIPENGDTLSNFWKMNDGETITTYTITTSATANYLCIYYGKGSSNDDYITEVLNGLQIELGSVATTYESYRNKTPYWYVYEEIGKTTLNTLTWVYSSNRFYSNSLTDGRTDLLNTRTKVLSDYFHFISSGSTQGGIFYYYNGNNRQIYTYNYNISTASDFHAWVSSVLPKLYYYLGVPKYTLITDTTLINQLNNLYEAKSYNDITNIIQENNDLPFILDVTTLSKEAI